MNRQDRTISRFTTVIATIVAVVMTILIPLGHFAVSYQYMLGSIEAQAEISARNITGMVMMNPHLWQYQEVRLSDLLQRRLRTDFDEIRRIIDRNGEVIAESKASLPSPVVTRSQDIYDAGTTVAKLEIVRSLRPLLKETALVAVAGLLSGVFIFAVLRVLPMRAVRRAYQSLEESEKKYRSLYDSMNEGMAVHRITYDTRECPVSFSVIDVNPACESILGVEKKNILGKDGAEIFNGAILHHLHDIVRQADTGESLKFELSLQDIQREFTVSIFSPERGVFATLLEDVTERKKSEQQIQKLAYYDSLTGLPNRLLFLDRINQALFRGERDNGKVALLFLDLDGFKVVNDSMGHSYGDLLLMQVSQRLRASVRSSDTVARLGGDEFVIVVSSIGKELNAAHIAQHLLDNITPSYMINGQEVYTSASIGVSIFPEDGSDADTLLRCADMAMYAAKESGRNGYNFYSKEMNRKAHERMELETSLRHALEREEFFLEFQPIIDANSNGFAGAEVLVRWQHPQRGRTMPDMFISIAEDTGLILPLGEWVLRTACRKMKEWSDAGLPQVRISVNVSGRQFAQNNFAEVVYGILEETGVDPHFLELELTETSLMANAGATVTTLNKLKGFNLSIAIDDFGAGYSSLGYLKNFPIDRIKIDRSFVKDVCGNPNDKAIVEAIIAMAGRLNLDVVAEGVETSEQLAFLRVQGCNEIQGYYFHRPLPEDRFVALRHEVGTL